jgi:hypothetical protein
MNFRANPYYELIMFEDLSYEEQTKLAALKQDPDFCCILRPNKSGLTMKAIGSHIADLFLKLSQPQTLPSYQNNTDAVIPDKTVIQMVLDNILEIETPEGFVSGIDAYSIYYKDKGISPTNNDDITNSLSAKALQYAQNLHLNDPIELSKRLYFYNRIPASVKWRKVLATKESVVSYLGIDRGLSYTIANKYWQMAESTSNQEWFFWHNRKPFNYNSNSKYKLYISPHPTYIKEVFSDVIRILARNNVTAFKVGATLYGILRPDKMVVYFSNLQKLKSTANELSDVLAGVRAQAVPFTALLDDQGMLSWGIDPPYCMNLLPWDATSWRHWITDRLASSLIQASNNNTVSHIEPWKFALERIKLDGINPVSWIPDEDIWK